jgi:hypothetical protein
MGAHSIGRGRDYGQCRAYSVRSLHQRLSGRIALGGRQAQEIIPRSPKRTIVNGGGFEGNLYPIPRRAADWLRGLR